VVLATLERQLRWHLRHHRLELGEHRLELFQGRRSDSAVEQPDAPLDELPKRRHTDHRFIRLGRTLRRAQRREEGVERHRARHQLARLMLEHRDRAQRAVDLDGEELRLLASEGCERRPTRR